jgi:Pyridoxamine 5'-phosphate oxidase
MWSLLVLLGLLSPSTNATILPPPQHVFSNPDASESSSFSKPGFRIPTVQESAVMARRILRHESIGTLSTVFPKSSSSSADTLENRPADVGGKPLGIMEYFADCEPDTGDPTILAVTIASSFKNVAAGSNITLSMRWHPPHRKHYSAAALPRVSLIGTLEQLSEEEIKSSGIKSCFAKHHPDSVIWMPGNDIHESHWVRLAVKEVYWFGGFGDRAYIGWIPVETWKNVTEEEIQKCRLPGERKHWKKPWASWFDSLEL